ncbi:hypothetical protein AMATHDRAFT_50523 [Amanita thiersii Skay4041]|uniref:DUF6534 domain-containing protein n=1 Tax=Amanita thiersii Skay4041 TaxID=703135 RepID=A0A2A9NFW2_9AGAR|nr:hypothetical protein AMATHDRAFT_50523 [Amanita thiersii Skay4041]
MLILDQVGWQWFSIPLMTGAISAITQIFYAWRIWILSHRPYIPIVITLLALVQGGAGIWSGVNAKLIGIFSQIQTRNGTSTIVWLVGTAVCDVLIAVCMIYYLSKSRAGFRATNELLVKLIRITVETGLVTAAVAVVDLAMFLAFKDANYHIVPSITLSKLYSNSLLVVSTWILSHTACFKILLCIATQRPGADFRWSEHWIFGDGWYTVMDASKHTPAVNPL